MLMMMMMVIVVTGSGGQRGAGDCSCCCRADTGECCIDTYSRWQWHVHAAR